MALLTRKRTLLAKIETTYGVDPTPSGAANAILVRNLTIAPQETEFADRDLVRPYLGSSEQLPAAIMATAEFEVEMAGSGTLATAPAWGPLLRACGFAQTINAGVSVAYDPVSAAFESVTIYFNVDGVLHKMLGARGNVSFEINAKQIPVFKFKLWGLYQTIADAAAPTVDYTAWKKPVVVNTTNTTGLTVHGFASAVLSTLSCDLANNVVHRQLVGGESVIITDRKPQGSLTLEAVTVAAKDWWTIAKNATLGAFSVVQGSAAGFKVQLDMPTVQLIAPNYTDLDGIQMLQMGLRPVPGATGNDEIKITVL